MKLDQSLPLHQEAFDKVYGAKCVDLSACGWLKNEVSKLTFDGIKFLRWLASWAPILQWLPSYRLKKCLLKDLLAGFTVGIMSIPQGMAYGMLAGLRPEYGLYTSLFPPLIYSIFGSSKHVSIGTFAVISLMVASVVDRKSEAVAVPIFPNHTSIFNNNHSVDSVCCELNGHSVVRNETLALQIAVSLTALVGIVQIILGIFNLGFLAVYLSDQLVQGLTTGAAIHVLASQIGHITGIRNLPRTTEPLGMFRFFSCLFLNITQVNWAELIASVVYMVLLIFVKEILDPVARQRVKFPVPIELLLVWPSLIYGVPKVWLNVFHTPCFTTGLVNILPDALTIGIIIYSIDVSVSKLFAKKHDYKIDANQEWFALGLVHVISSFLSCHCSGPSLSRSLIQSNQGGKTQVVSIVSSAIILLVVLALAAAFRDLPTCVLASIIIVALKGILKQFSIVPTLFKQSKIDFLIWVVTFSAVVSINISYGLAVGVGFALVSIIFRSQWPDSVCLGRIPDSQIYKGVEAYETAEQIPGIKIYRFDSPVYFANVEFFKVELYKCVGVDPFQAKGERRRKCPTGKLHKNDVFVVTDRKQKMVESSGWGSPVCSPTEIQMGSAFEPEAVKGSDALHHIIIDCSSFSYIDLMAVDVLADVYSEYEALGITVFFASCKIAVRQMLDRCGFYEKVPKHCLFVNIHDAVQRALWDFSTVRGNNTSHSCAFCNTKFKKIGLYS